MAPNGTPRRRPPRSDSIDSPEGQRGGTDDSVEPRDGQRGLARSLKRKKSITGDGFFFLFFNYESFEIKKGSKVYRKVGLNSLK